jgi:glycosyltransferase involved in cell wall biosynthesis
MKAEGWEVMSACADGEYIAELREAGYAIETLPIARSMHPIKAVKALAAMVRMFRRERFDVVHVHTPVAALLGRIAARLTGVPLVVYTAHGFYFHAGMPAWKRTLFVALERLAGRFTDLLFSQSAEDAETAVAEGITPREKVFVIGNGANTKRFDPRKFDRQVIRRGLSIPDDAFVIGFVGRLVEEKGVGEFLHAATILAPRFPQTWFMLVGDRLASDHAAAIDHELEAAHVALGARLLALGLRRDVPELMSAMDVFCLPSWREGMPRTIIEAMMMKRAVLATNIRGSREEVAAERTGLLVPVRDAVALAHGMERLIRDPDWAARLGQAGRERALEHFDEQKVVSFQLGKLAEFARATGLRP